jgi:phage tail-like protein
MRGIIEELPNPHPLGVALPAVYQEDDFTQRFTSALDAVLASVISTMDNLEAYLDPKETPADFLEWLAGWVGVVLDENWPLERQRTFVAEAVELYRWRGTVKGLSALVALYAGVEPEIVDTGGVEWSATPYGRIPGEPEPRFTIRLRVPDRSAVDVDRLDAIVRAAKPAHVLHQIELVGPGRETAKQGPKNGPKGGEPEAPKAGQVPPARPEPETGETPTAVELPPAKPEPEPEAGETLKVETAAPETPKTEATASEPAEERSSKPKPGNGGSVKASGSQAKKDKEAPNGEGEVPAE